MILIDRLYLNIYWCHNHGNGNDLASHMLEMILIIPLGGIFMLVFAMLENHFGQLIPTFGLIATSLILANFIVVRIVTNYFTDEKKEEIIKNYKKPGPFRYVVFTFLLLSSIVLSVVCFSSASTFLL